jgi:signal transduction histidine kinase
LNDVILDALKDMKSFSVEADRERLVQAVSNLLSNAVKFSREIHIWADIIRGDETRRYGINARRLNNSKTDVHEHVLVSVRDKGVGINPDIKPKLFSKFATKSFNGIGLGLSVSKSIIEAHGGKIWGENNTDGQGATFGFSLPISL